MTTELLSHFLQNPSQLDAVSGEALRELTKEYPYFQAARLLLAKNHQLINSDAYKVSLRLAAAYAPNRSMLKALIENRTPVAGLQYAPAEAAEYFIKETEVQTVETEDKITPQPEVEAIENPSAELRTREPELAQQHIESIDSSAENKAAPEDENALIDLIRGRLSESITEIPVIDSAPVEIGEEESEKSILHRQLIDNFIRQEPRITPPRQEFFHPDDNARQSTSLPEDIASETLAHIFESQGHIDIALKIYQKLILLFPEKRSNFAARIEELEKKRK